MANKSKYAHTEDIVRDGFKHGAKPSDVVSNIMRQHPTIIEDTGGSANSIRCYVNQQFRKYRVNTDHSALAEECENVGIPTDKVSAYWYKGEHFSILVKGEQYSYEDMRDEFIKEMSSYAPKYPRLERTRRIEPKLLVIDPADVHFGKYATEEETGDGYNLDIATKRFHEGIEGILQKVSHYGIEHIVFLGGNDILHTDAPHRKTTSGTPQDTDGMWFEAFQAAKNAYIKAIETLITIADVTFINCPSNHDYMSGIMLCDSVASWFANNPHFHSNVGTAHRKYFHYGLNLIGVTHGDGAKEKDLPDLMKTEARKAYADSVHSYWYTHHLHHKIRKAYLGRNAQLIEQDDIGVTIINTNTGIENIPTKVTQVEYLRSASGTDSWHHRNGYQHNPKAIEAFIHDPNFGQEARITHIF